MPKDHTVEDNQFLLSIARDYGFRTDAPIIAANPGLAEECAGNFDVLLPGSTLVIPDLTPRIEPAATDASHKYCVQWTRKDLVITIQAPDGSEIDSGKWEISYPGGPKKGVLNRGRLVVEDWPIAVTEALLTITLHYEPAPSDTSLVGFTVDAFQSFFPGGDHQVEIKLHIGGTDPIVGSERAQAVQKLLTNLGYYSGGIDGKLGPRSRAAIRKFQHRHTIKPSAGSLVDEEMLSILLREIKTNIGQTPGPLPEEPKKRDHPLDLGWAPTSVQSMKDFSGYIEPTKEFSDYLDTTNPERPIKRTAFQECPPVFTPEAYVATSDPKSNKNPNIIRMKSKYFIFVDSGRWLAEAPIRDFTVIWGSHAYRCEYLPDLAKDRLGVTENLLTGDPYDQADRLDRIFFAGMKGHVKVVQRASAFWAHETEFDWDTLIIVLPDMHLMAGGTGSGWRHGGFRLSPELDLLDFAHRLVNIDGLKDKVQAIQIGDSYDLWVNCAPRYFRKNDELRMEWVPNEEQTWNCGLIAHMREVEGPGKTIRWEERCSKPHHSRGEPCEVPKDSFGVNWNCGRLNPPCPGDHRDFNSRCESGELWSCRKTEPPCPGHTRREDLCTEDIEGTAADRVCAWIQHIQGRSNGWVEPLIRDRVGKEGLPEGLGSIDDLEDELAEDASNEPGKKRWLNPAYVALRLLQRNFDTTFIWGNHDNYLAIREVTQRAGIARRDLLWESQGVYVEHGHRLERFLPGIISQLPSNADGAVDGYDKTMLAYHVRSKDRDLSLYDRKTTEWGDAVADEFAALCQQPNYWAEFAQIWLGRYASGSLRPPHIFVIGHTHMPNAMYVELDFNGVFQAQQKSRAAAAGAGGPSPTPAPNVSPGSEHPSTPGTVPTPSPNL